eukprot:3582792-Pyramimonas_sp.AAC.1
MARRIRQAGAITEPKQQDVCKSRAGATALFATDRSQQTCAACDGGQWKKAISLTHPHGRAERDSVHPLPCLQTLGATTSADLDSC